MGRIWTETGAIRAIRRKGYLNCFSSPQRRYFVISAIALSNEGSHLRYSVGCALMLERKLELVRGDSFCAAYRLKGQMGGGRAARSSSSSRTP
ncbi:MAG TPA: hypothetical protein VIZ17_04320 [Acetobacteraceae bacterium]